MNYPMFFSVETKPNRFGGYKLFPCIFPHVIFFHSEFWPELELLEQQKKFFLQHFHPNRKLKVVKVSKESALERFPVMWFRSASIFFVLKSDCTMFATGIASQEMHLIFTMFLSKPHSNLFLVCPLTVCTIEKKKYFTR